VDGSDLCARDPSLRLNKGFARMTPHEGTELPDIPVGSKLKCPVFVASEMSGFKVVPSPIGLGWFWGWGCRGRGQFHFPCSSL